MDPNATLLALRRLLGGDHSGYEETPGSPGEIHKVTDDGNRVRRIPTAELHTMLCEAEELFQAMDEWLSSGGFLPKRWAR